MKEIEIQEVTTVEQLESLGSALTWEGLSISEESLNQLYAWLEDYTTVKRRVVYLTKGAVMNRLYGLTGNNAYPADLHIVSIDLNDLGDIRRIALVRFECGGRWLDDIIANNAEFDED